MMKMLYIEDDEDGIYGRWWKWYILKNMMKMVYIKEDDEDGIYIKEDDEDGIY